MTSWWNRTRFVWTEEHASSRGGSGAAVGHLFLGGLQQCVCMYGSPGVPRCIWEILTTHRAAVKHSSTRRHMSEVVKWGKCSTVHREIKCQSPLSNSTQTHTCMHAQIARTAFWSQSPGLFGLHIFLFDKLLDSRQCFSRTVFKTETWCNSLVSFSLEMVSLRY